MTGSLQIKKQKYYVVLNIYNGKKRTPTWIATGLSVLDEKTGKLIKKNKKQAEEFLKKKIDEISLCPNSIKDILFSEYAKKVLNDIKSSIDIVTWEGYYSVIYRHIIPYFEEKNMLIKNITRADIQEYINQKREDGRIDGKGGLSAKSLKIHKLLINKILNSAELDGLIIRNCCNNIIMPKVEKYRPNFYTTSQIKDFLESIKDNPLYPVFLIVAFYGLRRSELLGLKWDSVDFKENKLCIKYTVSAVSTVVEKDKTKNTSSYRYFPLVDEVKEILLKIKESEQLNRNYYGNEYVENDYIFKWDDGRTFQPNYLSKKLKKILQEKGLLHIRLHDLRHSCASSLLAKGCGVKDIQEWMGHDDIRTTLNTYAHLSPERKGEMSKIMSDAILNN